MTLLHIQNDRILIFIMLVVPRLDLHKYLPELLTTNQADSMYVLVRDRPPLDSDFKPVESGLYPHRVLL